MSGDQLGTEDFKKKLQLKLPEPEIVSKDPWSDDALDRLKVADALTDLIRHQSDSLVVSLNGQMGDRQNLSSKALAKEVRARRFSRYLLQRMGR